MIYVTGGYLIVGKYKVQYPGVKGTHTNSMYTDNPREAVWEANKLNGTPINISGDRDFYNDGKRWRLI